MFNKKGHITIAILVLLLGAVTMMFFLFRSGKYQRPTDIEEWLLKNQSVVKDSSSKELVQKDRDSETDTKEGRSKEETETEMEKSEIDVEEQSKEPSEQELFASTPIGKETETLKKPGKPELEEKDLRVVQEELDLTEVTPVAKEDNKGPKKGPKQGMIASIPTDKKTEDLEKSEKPKFVERSSPIDVFEKSPSNDSGLKEEVEGEEGNSSEEASPREEPFTVVSKKDIEEIQRKTWAALEFLKD